MDNKLLAGIKVLDLTQIYQGPYAAFSDGTGRGGSYQGGTE